MVCAASPRFSCLCPSSAGSVLAWLPLSKASAVPATSRSRGVPCREMLSRAAEAWVSLHPSPSCRGHVVCRQHSGGGGLTTRATPSSWESPVSREASEGCKERGADPIASASRNLCQ